jgi:hypothetical protein
MLRSSNNGATWESVPNTSTHMFYAVGSDGNKIYIGGSGAVSAPWSAWFTSPETDGNNWTQCPGPTAPDGITDMHYDSINHIMYSANATAGIWALKVNDASTTNVVKASAAAVNRSALVGNGAGFAKTCLTIRTAAGKIYDVKGRNIGARLK